MKNYDRDRHCCDCDSCGDTVYLHPDLAEEDITGEVLCGICFRDRRADEADRKLCAEEDAAEARREEALLKKHGY